MGMTVNTNKTKIMMIKSKKETYANFIYDNRNLEEVTSYKYLLIDILALKITINQPIWSCGIKISFYLKLLSSLLCCMVVKHGGATFLENLGGGLGKSKNGL